VATNPAYFVKKATAKETTQRCPYAGVFFSVGDTLAVCAACKTAHLEESWTENRGCTAYGCENAPDFRKDESTLQVNLVETQADDGAAGLSGLDTPRGTGGGTGGDEYELNELVPTAMPGPSRAAQGQRPQPAAQQPAHTEEEQANNTGLEYVSLALGVVSILGCWCFGVPSLLLGAAGTVCWFVSLSPRNRERMIGSMGNVGMAGLICGLLGMILGALAVGFILAAAARK
jgi:hypothetical protein